MKIAIGIYIVGVIVSFLVCIFNVKESKERLEGEHIFVSLYSWVFLIFLFIKYLSNILIYDFGKTSKMKNKQKK